VGHLSGAREPSSRELPSGFEPLDAVRARIRERMARVEKTIAVMSGKGGVGKSAVAVNLALALSQQGHRTGILDADLHGPSVAKMLGLRGQPVRVAPSGLRPTPGPLNVLVQSMDFFLQGSQPLELEGDHPDAASLRSLLEEATLADLLGGTEWGDLAFLIVDMPPGADRLPALARLHPGLAGALAVTIPTEVALLAVERSIRRAREAKIPLVGLVENMARAVCTSCGAETALFREASVDLLADETDLAVLARIPFDPRLAEAADQGRPFLDVSGRASPAGRALEALAARVAEFEAASLDSW
jgi:ATP-binding protein involved in chromosome partitioning